MAATSTREYRRFTAVLILHPALLSPADVKRRLGKSIGRLAPLRDVPPGWDAVRAEYLFADRSFYPEHIATARSRARADRGYAHDIYLASKDLGPGIGPAIFIASPYIRLLGKIIEQLVDSLPEPAVQYVDVQMPAVYRWLDEDSRFSAAVNRVSMQIVGEPYADLVSLSGKRPLHSKVHDKLTSVTVPYGLGVRITYRDIECRVGLDRHGAFHWFQTSEDCVANPLMLIDLVNAAEAFRKSRRLPLLHEARDRVVEAESW